MAEALRAHLYSPTQARQPFENAWKLAKSMLLAGHRLTLEVKPEKRSPSQSDKFHAMCRDFARSGIEWAGKRRTEDEWKVLLVSGHAVATKLGAEVVPGLEGEFVNIRESTASMTKARGSSLIEYTYAIGADKGVAFTGEAMQ